jgi:hypothetical protein
MAIMWVWETGRGLAVTKNIDLFRVRIWGVIGPPGAGKSSVIGALISQTGQGGGGARDVLLRGGGWLHINAFRRSVQEAQRSPEVAVEKILKVARTRQNRGIFAFHNVLLALRSDNQTGFPIAEEYLRYFIKIGWEIESLVLLEANEYDRYARFGVPLAFIENSAEMTSVPLQRNWVFGMVRNHFAWA